MKKSIKAVLEDSIQKVYLQPGSCFKMDKIKTTNLSKSISLNLFPDLSSIQNIIYNLFLQKFKKRHCLLLLTLSFICKVLQTSIFTFMMLVPWINYKKWSFCDTKLSLNNLTMDRFMTCSLLSKLLLPSNPFVSAPLLWRGRKEG